MSTKPTNEQIDANWKREIRGLTPDNFREEFRFFFDNPQMQHVMLSLARKDQISRLNDYDLEDMLESDDPEVRAAAEEALQKTRVAPARRVKV